MAEAAALHQALHKVLREFDQAHVAVSGGVDSMTLAHAARTALGPAAVAVHATSPAVPPTATERVRAHAVRYGWRLEIIDAGEFADPDYRANPVNRCFYCKTSLYGSIARRFGGPILSGTNTDDLGDYRPGLQAAAAHDVRHPFVEAGIDKSGVRALARHYGLDDLAELPASPCLSSRILTGLAVTEPRLAGILVVEERLQQALGAASTLRCRVLDGGIELQLDTAALARWQAGLADELLPEVAVLCRRHGLGETVAVAPYRRGSAFVGDKTAAAGRHAV
jgi:uncharacterized protein